MGILAWHIHWLTLHTREDPHANADSLFGKEDQEILLRISTQKMMESKRTVTGTKRRVTRRKRKLMAIECLMCIAKLGGFLNRRSDGFPGLEDIWRGLSRFDQIKSSLQLLRHIGHFFSPTALSTECYAWANIAVFPLYGNDKVLLPTEF
jgi:hypothetical protein